MKIISTAAVALIAMTVGTGAALAQDQNGLVNLSVDGNTVQVPVGIAANVCDLDANVLAEQFVGSEDTACTIDQETAAENNIGDFGNGNGNGNGNGQNGGNGQGGNNGNQEGLVNVSVDGNTVQVPVGVAANVCDVDANVLAQQFVGSEDTACTIDQETAAENNIGSN